MLSDRYIATDDDLPENMFREIEREKATPEQNAELLAQLHFPVIKETDLTKSQQRSLARDRKEAAEGIEDKKVYIKIGKKRQMFWWLDAMQRDNVFGAMDFNEREFCERWLEKFKKYTVQRTKWITKKQYEWCRRIAAKYLISGKVKL